MHELLFRGQQRRKGEKVRIDGSPVESSWFYGNGVLQGKGDFSIIYLNEPTFEKLSVYTDTLGQYTGLTDMNEKKIFEGDIVQNIITKETAIVRWYTEHSAFMLYDKNNNKVYFLYDNDFNKIEIIGNIYDNPELLEV